MMIQFNKHRGRSSIKALLSILILASLHKISNFTTINNDDDNNQSFYHRMLSYPNMISNNKGDNLIANYEESTYNSNDTFADYDAAALTAADEHISRALHNSNNISYQSIQNYTFKDAIYETTIFNTMFCLLLYDPTTNKFLVLYSKDSDKYKQGNKKLWRAINTLCYLLRRIFPERFTEENEELVLAIGGGDYPHVKLDKLPHVDGIAPVLMFGSSFQYETNMYPNMIAMPQPVREHLDCFAFWVESDMKKVCSALSSLKFDEDWDSLIPQLIWRGSDVTYLLELRKPSLFKPFASAHVDSSLKDEKTRRVNAVHSLMGKIDTLVPRWKGVVLTADAELQAQDTGNIPWANIKFAGNGPPILGTDKWKSIGIDTVEHMNLQELAKYKYHIDLGGGGGTTWTGTIHKLAMPGLLFHHVTPMKDYIHDYLIPWKHYIPVSADLKDLKQKFNWAESHSVEAKRIADASTDFMRELSTPQGFRKMFEQAFVEPLSKVIDSYQPVASVHDGMTWREFLQSMGSECRLRPVFECTGDDLNSCQMVSTSKITHNMKMNWIELSHLTDMRTGSTVAVQ